METMNNSERIINSYSLVAFAQKFGSDLSVGTCTSSGGEKFQVCAFNDGNRRTFVDFGKSLEGGLTPEEIKAQINDLQVVQLNVEPDVLERRTAAKKQLETYKLCRKGESNWSSINLFA